MRLFPIFVDDSFDVDIASHFQTQGIIDNYSLFQNLVFIIVHFSIIVQKSMLYMNEGSHAQVCTVTRSNKV